MHHIKKNVPEKSSVKEHSLEIYHSIKIENVEFIIDE